jgi:hypothetical protein
MLDTAAIGFGNVGIAAIVQLAHSPNENRHRYRLNSGQYHTTRLHALTVLTHSRNAKIHQHGRGTRANQCVIVLKIALTASAWLIGGTDVVEDRTKLGTHPNWIEA